MLLPGLVIFPRQLAQRAPAGVLPGFRGIGVLTSVQPEVEPVHGGLLRDVPVLRLLEDMLGVLAPPP
jgi:hypothetical protein